MAPQVHSEEAFTSLFFLEHAVVVSCAIIPRRQIQMLWFPIGVEFQITFRAYGTTDDVSAEGFSEIHGEAWWLDGARNLF